MVWGRGGSCQPEALMRVVGWEAGAELKQGERRELILLFRGHSRQARELGGLSQHPPCRPWSLPGQLLHSDQPTGLGQTKDVSWGEAQPLPQGSRKGDCRVNTLVGPGE